MPIDDMDFGGLARDFARIIPRRVTEGASAPDAAPFSWLVDPPRGEGNPPAQTFYSQEAAEEYALKCPPRTRIVQQQSDRGMVFSDTFPPLTAADFCTEAARLVSGDRAATHGDKLINFQNIAELWNGYWRIKCRVNNEPLVTPFDAHDVGCMMELFKIARRFSGKFNADDYVDAAGYAGCAGEIAAAKEHS